MEEGVGVDVKLAMVIAVKPGVGMETAATLGIAAAVAYDVSARKARPADFMLSSLLCGCDFL